MKHHCFLSLKNLNKSKPSRLFKNSQDRISYVKFKGLFTWEKKKWFAKHRWEEISNSDPIGVNRRKEPKNSLKLDVQIYTNNYSSTVFKRTPLQNVSLLELLITRKVKLWISYIFKYKIVNIISALMISID